MGLSTRFGTSSVRPGAPASLLASVLASVLACVLVSAPATAHADERVVRLWHAYGDDSAEERGLLEALEAFERRHGNVRVEVLAVAFDAYASKLESAIPTGEGPDVFIDAHERLYTYNRAGLLAEHAPAGELPHGVRADFERAHLEALTMDGALRGLPLSLKCPALYVNDALGPPDVETLEQIERLQTPDGVHRLVFEAENPYYVTALLHAYGAELLRDDEYAFEGPAAERAVRHLRALVRGGVVPEEADGKMVEQLFASGDAATAISGPWLAPDLPETLSWHVEPLPRVEAAGGAPMVPFVTVEAALLARDPDRPELARELIAFLAGPEGSRIRARVGRQVVASRGAWTAPALANDTLLTTFREAADRGRPMPTRPKMRMTWEPAEQAIKNVLRGNAASIDGALAEGGRRFADLTRPPPPRRDPTLALVAVGLVLLVATGWAVRRARDPAFRQRLRASRTAYRYMAHAFVLVGLLVGAPIAGIFVTALFGGRGMDMHYVGLANFAEILTARGGDLLGRGSFWLVLLVTILWTVLNIALHVAIGVVLALVLYRPTLALKTPYRIALILPWAVPSYVTALAWKGMFNRQFGAMNELLRLLGAEPVSWFAHWAIAFGANVATNVWLGFPFMMVVTLGALAAIPGELYEAAEVDGASAWQRFRHVTVPMLGPSLAPAVAMGAVWTFNMFNVVFLVSGGEPDGTTEILISDAYRWAFTRSQQYGYAAAYGVLIFGLLLLASRWFAGGLERTEATG